MPHDIGRSIETFAHKTTHPELVDDLRRVLASGQAVERDLVDDAGRSFFLRTLPYRAKGAADGVVLSSDILDRIDEIVPPAHTVNIADNMWRTASLDAASRRR